MSSEGGISSVTPGKYLSKKGGMREPVESDSRCSYNEAGAKRVQVKEPSYIGECLEKAVTGVECADLHRWEWQ